VGDVACTLDDLPANLDGGWPGTILLGKGYGVVLVGLVQRL
jgi:hypothetical protein